MKPTDVMTTDELSEYLQLSQSSLYNLAQKGRVPGQKIGEHWHFSWLRRCRALIPPGLVRNCPPPEFGRWRASNTRLRSRKATLGVHDSNAPTRSGCFVPGSLQRNHTH